MVGLRQPRFRSRYDIVTEEKAGGAVYTPKLLADFVARQIVNAAGEPSKQRPLRVMDPAVGQGELLVSLLKCLSCYSGLTIEVYGFETDEEALDIARKRLGQLFPGISLHFEQGNFLEFVLENFGSSGQGNLLRPVIPEAYDLLIANPPYVRTQIMGATRARLLADKFDLSGRVDLYYAFILGISRVLESEGVAGIIVSNRFMTTKSGAPVRQAISERFFIRHAWDLGDTKLFDAAVLPAVLLVGGKGAHNAGASAFTSIYQTSQPANTVATDPISALDGNGVVEIDDGRRFQIQHGELDTSGKPDGVWRIATQASESWLAAVHAHSWGTFRDIGKVRVGVKTCADKIFIRNDWQDMSQTDRPELLKRLTTHRMARCFKPLDIDRPSQILYPHEVVQGRRRAVDLKRFPRAEAYLVAQRSVLEGRKYVIEAGREWYEIWVPQDPNAWDQPKLVFRDIAAKPTFWIDLDGSVVNGDCYWILDQSTENIDLLWLAVAVGNSTLIERYYDFRFNNKLYAGRRRFITQYVEKFPLPDPESDLGKAIIGEAKRIYECTPSKVAEQLHHELDKMVWQSLTGSTVV